MNKVYKNSTEIANLDGASIYMNDLVDACLYGRLNLFLQGDTGSGKTQLARDAMGYFGTGTGNREYAKQIQEKYKEALGEATNIAINSTKYFPKDKTLFILGRNDMDTRELFQRFNLGKLNQKPKYDLEPLVNPETGDVEWYYPTLTPKGIFVYKKITPEQAKIVKSKLEHLAGNTEELKEITSKINTNLVVVDELPNCVPAVRAQLFNLFDGYIEINGVAYPIGNGYSVGIATGNIGQQFTESSNELGRALKDRMHVIVDTDYFSPKPSDTLEILAGNTNPRVDFGMESDDLSDKIIAKSKEISSRQIPLTKLLVANYLLHGLDYCSKGSKKAMKGAWPTQLESHEQGSDVGLILPVSPRAAKSIIRLSQSFDDIVRQKGRNPNEFESMMTAYKLVSSYSGVLNEADVQNKYDENHYKAMDAVISTTRTQFNEQDDNIGAGLEMVSKGEKDQKVLDKFKGRWAFMRDTLEGILNQIKPDSE